MRVASTCLGPPHACLQMSGASKKFAHLMGLLGQLLQWEMPEFQVSDQFYLNVRLQLTERQELCFPISRICVFQLAGSVFPNQQDPCFPISRNCTSQLAVSVFPNQQELCFPISRICVSQSAGSVLPNQQDLCFPISFIRIQRYFLLY